MNSHPLPVRMPTHSFRNLLYWPNMKPTCSRHRQAFGQLTASVQSCCITQQICTLTLRAPRGISRNGTNYPSAKSADDLHAQAPVDEAGGRVGFRSELAYLPGADADVAGRHVGVLADVLGQLRHEGLAEPHHLRMHATTVTTTAPSRVDILHVSYDADICSERSLNRRELVTGSSAATQNRQKTPPWCKVCEWC